MSILVISCSGFLDPRVIRRLIARGEDVVCRDSNPGAASFASLEDRGTVLRGDVTQFDVRLQEGLPTSRALRAEVWATSHKSGGETYG